MYIFISLDYDWSSFSVQVYDPWSLMRTHVVLLQEGPQQQEEDDEEEEDEEDEEDDDWDGMEVVTLTWATDGSNILYSICQYV